MSYGANRALSQSHTKKFPLYLSLTRRDIFFEIIESGIEDRFPEFRKSSNHPMSRIAEFLDYAKKKRSVPVSMEPYHEPCEEYVPGLRAIPWWDTNDFEWIEELEMKSKSIIQELQHVLQQESEKELGMCYSSKDNKDKSAFIGDSRYQQTMGVGWSAFRLQRYGEWIETNLDIFPITSDIIKSLNIPLAIRGVMIAKQDKNSGVSSHSDGRNFILTCHLGLLIPKNGPCWIQVGDERRVWKEQKSLIFDTSFVHETGNESNDEERYVLIIDFWHPDLTQDEQQALQYIYEARNKFDNGRAKDIDCSYVRQGNPLDVAQLTEQKSLWNIFRNNN